MDKNKSLYEISNTDVYGLEKSIKRSGYPKRTEQVEGDNSPLDYKRAKSLGKAKSGSGHDNFLKGIVVDMDIMAPSYWWPQFQRYHFADIISSESKMHMLTKFNISDSCNPIVWNETTYRLQRLCDYYNTLDPKEHKAKRKEIFWEILNNTPLGFNLKAGIVTNYLQLKTIVQQRKGHKLNKEWGPFIEWVHNLPMFDELTSIEQNKTHD